MASYTVPNGHIGAYDKELTAETVDTVTFEIGVSTASPGWADVPKEIEVYGDGSASIFFTTDGTTPTVGGTNCHWVPAGGASSLVVDVRDDNPVDAVVVKVISAGTPVYSVARTA